MNIAEEGKSMKNTISVLLAAVLTLLLCACGSEIEDASEEAEKAVSQFCDALIGNDFEGVASLFENAEIPLILPDTDNWLAQSSYIEQVITQNRQTATFNTQVISVDEKAATVLVSFTVLDARPIAVAAGEDALKELPVMGGNTDTAISVFEEAFAFRIKNTSANMSAVTITFSCAKIGEDWLIEPLSDSAAASLLRVETLNMFGALEEIVEEWENSGTANVDSGNAESMTPVAQEPVTDTEPTVDEQPVSPPTGTNSAEMPTFTQEENRKVYRTETGKRYHYDGNCNGGTYYECTLEEALAAGLTPCQKCT